MPWRYRLPTRYEAAATELAGVEYDGPWLTVSRGRIAIPAGYCWDGCSPTLRLPGGFWLGPPDGPLGIDGRPVSWRASLVHDALCQHRADLAGLGKAATVALFARMLAEAGAPIWMRKLYPTAVDRLGPQQWPGDLDMMQVFNQGDPQ